MRRHPDGSILTFPATLKATGERVLVDDRTFDPEQHEVEDAVDGTKRAPKGAKAPKGA